MAKTLSFIVAVVLCVHLILPGSLFAAPRMSEDLDSYSVGKLVSEMVHVYRVIVHPDGSVQVFFATENTYTLNVTEGSVQTRRYHIYTEVVE